MLTSATRCVVLSPLRTDLNELQVVQQEQADACLRVGLADLVQHLVEPKPGFGRIANGAPWRRSWASVSRCRSRSSRAFVSPQRAFVSRSSPTFASLATMRAAISSAGISRLKSSVRYPCMASYPITGVKSLERPECSDVVICPVPGQPGLAFQVIRHERLDPAPEGLLVVRVFQVDQLVN
jgi:hypothetical protein